MRVISKRHRLGSSGLVASGIFTILLGSCGSGSESSGSAADGTASGGASSSLDAVSSSNVTDTTASVTLSASSGSMTSTTVMTALASSLATSTVTTTSTTGSAESTAGSTASTASSSTGDSDGAGATSGTGDTLATASNSETGASSTGAGGTGGGPSILAATPPMGWNSWNTFQCEINEELIHGVADTIEQSGMQAAGYVYVNLDDCWMDGRDGSGELRWNTSKFPSGMPALAEYIHGKGLKFGIYESANSATCVGLYGGVDQNVAVGSLGHEAVDAATFASWGVDYLKYDLCAGQRSSLVAMGEALRAGTRPILYSINPGNGENDLDPPEPNWDMAGVANIWRIGFDIGANWDSVLRLIDQNADLYEYAGPGGYNDPDMLEVGKLANVNEDRAHFAMWAIMAAPLIAGNDIRSMSDTTREILINDEIIAVDQDPLGIQGRLVATPGTNLQVWSKELSGTDTRAVVLFNRGDSPASISVQWSELGLPESSATVRDLWSHTDLGSFEGSYTASDVPAHGAGMIRVTSAG